MDKVKSLIKSRRFWAASFGVVAVVASNLFEVELNVEQLTAIAVMVSAWILGDTVRPTE